ncbi:MAG: AMP-binding protein [Candidatus Eiseniibacteriota bacterium]
MKPTVFASFAEAAQEAPDRAFLVVPPSAAKAYAPSGVTLSYREMLARAEALKARYAAAGYGHGQRVAILLENRPAFVEHWLALNALGASVVPVNPFYRSEELTYLLGHSDAVLAVSIASRVADLVAAAKATGRTIPVIAEDAAEMPKAISPAPRRDAPGPATECGLLYTSGTTGNPKGCILTNEYFWMMGDWYVNQGGLCPVVLGAERMLTPLPMFHMNAMACSFMAMVLSRGTLILLDRFHPSTWWPDVAETQASIIHYLGVMPAILLNIDKTPAERAHKIKFGFGANADPVQQVAFEEHFGFPLIEGWAMTETGAGATIAANREPRRPGMRCIGKAENCEVRLVDDAGNEVPAGEPGQLLVRHTGPDPKKGFFSGYYKDAKATEAAWAGGWFHTGDVARRDADGLMYFVDRSKNVIRRAGENIAALEVETVLLKQGEAAQVAVIAVPDELRDEEVMACVVPAAGVKRDEATARRIVTWCLDRMAYYKAPGYVLFLDTLPTTATNKVRKTSIQEMGGDPRQRAGCFDLRSMKRPQKTASA